MAEISALNPSPPGMGNQSVHAHSSPLPLPSETPISKSSLCGDRAVMGNPTLQAGGGKISPGSIWEATPAQNSSAPSTMATKCPADPPVLAAADGGSNGKMDLIGHTEAQCSEQEHEMPFSLELNPNPNLYPNVQINQISNPAPPSYIPPELPFPSVSIFAEHPSTSNPAPIHSSQDSSQTSAAPSEAQALTQNPKSSTPSTDKTAPEPLCTPSKVEPPVVLVQESGGALGLPYTYTRPAPDTLSYLESASLMSGTLESLSGLGEDGSSLGSDSEINGPLRRTDKYGFLGGAQYSESSWIKSVLMFKIKS